MDSRKCVVAANDSMDSLTEALSNCQEQLRLAVQQLDERCEPLKEVPSEAPIPESRWTDQFTSAMCCSPPPRNSGSWARTLYLQTLLPLRAETMCPSKLLMKSIFMCVCVCVVLTSTGVCNGAILFCQPNLKHCNHVCQSSVVFLRCGHILVSSVLQ